MASSNAWTLRSNVPSRTFERLLGRNELGFYWDSQFNGTADTFQVALVEVLYASNNDIFNTENISQTWIALKRQFPLLGAHLDVQEDGDLVSFLVDEDRLEHNGPGEITFQSVTSSTEAQAYIDNVVNGKRLLSDELLACVIILTPADQRNYVHIVIHVAHLITDGMSNSTILRSFLDVLSSLPNDKQWDLGQRLALAIPSDELASGDRTNKARLRWHRAMGQVISGVRFSKMNGGHTLPREFTDCTQYIPARSGFRRITFDLEESTRILQNCRTRGITLGHALPVLAQVALARVLCRRYVQGEMSKEEWNFRRREPTVTGGPINLRPFLDREWYQAGGSINVSLVIGFYHYRLPFMPLGSAANLSPGDSLPSFRELLSPTRFLYRSGIIKKQAKDYFKHPLFIYVAGARSTSSIQKFREVVRSWKEKSKTVGTPIPVMEQTPVYAHGGSSMGDMDSFLPRSFPLATVNGISAPRLYLHASTTKLHCRPAELYLGATTIQKKLHMSVFWDQNVYKENVVKEWLYNIQEATEFYLGCVIPKHIQVHL